MILMHFKEWKDRLLDSLFHLSREGSLALVVKKYGMTFEDSASGLLDP